MVDLIKNRANLERQIYELRIFSPKIITKFHCDLTDINKKVHKLVIFFRIIIQLTKIKIRYKIQQIIISLLAVRKYIS